MSEHVEFSMAANLGQIAGLMAGTGRYGKVSVDELVRVVLPPLRLGQYVMLWDRHITGMLVGYASWALFSEETERVFRNRERKLVMTDWYSGNRMWVLDFVAPGRALELTKLVQAVVSKRYDFVKVGKFRRGTLGGETRREGYVHRLKSEDSHASV